MIQPGTAYLVLDDRDLLDLVKHCNATGRRLGSDVGLLSYNDNPLKEVVAGGVSVISIDFYGLGVRAGRRTSSTPVRCARRSPPGSSCAGPCSRDRAVP